MRVCYLDLDGTLLGPEGNLLRDGEGAFSADGITALRRLHDAGVPFVLVSGRKRSGLDEIGRALGAAGVIAELGACEAGYPTQPGQSVHGAIAASGVVEHLLAWADGTLAPYEPWASGREGTHLLAGTAGPGADQLVETLSQGTLRLVDNGRIGEGRRAYHLMPLAAGKGPAVSRDIALRDADAGSCLAVGDSRADLELVGVVGLVAIVANALDDDPDLGARAPWVTAGAHGAGVLEAVDRWLRDDPELEKIR